jgi:hypothetical protein
MTCVESTWKHYWSIEGWIHSNRRDRFGQKLVELLVLTHTNLKLEQRLEMYEDGLLPWDIEMTVEESVSLEQRLEMYEDGLLPWDIEMMVEESVSFLCNLP